MSVCLNNVSNGVDSLEVAIHTTTSVGIVSNKIMHVKYSENFLSHINFSINVKYYYLIMKRNQETVSAELLCDKSLYKLKAKAVMGYFNYPSKINILQIFHSLLGQDE